MVREARLFFGGFLSGESLIEGVGYGGWGERVREIMGCFGYGDGGFLVVGGAELINLG